MSTTTTRTQYLTCDRCDKKSESYNPMHTTPSGWRKVTPNVGLSGIKDVCPRCFAEFNTWWNDRKKRFYNR
ncbi:hypothetical protein PP304_gp142 [Gordonia phage Phendrix]|uniref:Uncharacterized protein n=1 Tax=Gordonia phage Phendrix TaxID=2593335 RepID=A0A514U1B6_9CAUD|nr:hypothetical protein PP304_gp142 [Gordonia phage Phendrix]QDK02727.1 hypothetical protein SEA_PHENDRIX_211 [Gordonia phage Phendrix]